LTPIREILYAQFVKRKGKVSNVFELPALKRTTQTPTESVKVRSPFSNMKTCTQVLQQEVKLCQSESKLAARHIKLYQKRFYKKFLCLLFLSSFFAAQFLFRFVSFFSSSQPLIGRTADCMLNVCVCVCVCVCVTFFMCRRNFAMVKVGWLLHM